MAIIFLFWFCIIIRHSNGEKIMTISPAGAQPVYYAPAAYTMPVQNAQQNPVYTTQMQAQPAMNVGPNAKGEPDLVCNAQYDAKEKIIRLSSFERGWLDSNIWYAIKADGSGETISAWGIGAQYPAGTFSNVFNRAQGIYYTQGNIPEGAALDLVKDTRAAVDVARQNGTEVVLDESKSIIT